MNRTPTENSPNLEDTDLCVMCGMCLPHCPTYRVFQKESESPRGRIALIQAYNQSRLPLSDNLLEHLDHCLGCMACEAMCPSRVPYGHLLDEMKALTSRQKQPSFLQRELLDTVKKKNGLAGYASAIKWARFARIDKFLKLGLEKTGHGNISQIIDQITPASLQNYYPSPESTGKSVALFHGCMGTSFDSETLFSSIVLLNHLGFDVVIPKQQGCCGALHRHNGEIEEARQLALGNQNAFQALTTDQVIFTSNGCGAQLLTSLSGLKVHDISSFILSQPKLAERDLSPLDGTALVHESCSSLNKLSIGGVSEKLLDIIPALKQQKFNTAQLCCGAGGSHQLTHPNLAASLGDIKMDEIRRLKPDYLVTDNLGCGLHFKAGLQRAGITLEVIHPVTLISRQLKY